MCIEEEKKLIDYNNWTQKKTVKIFWNNNTISKICENWIFCCNNYEYIRSEELHTHLSELLYTREHKAGLSNKKSCIYVDIDELKISSDACDENIFKLKKEYIHMQDKINDKFNKIFKVIDVIVKINYRLEKNISYINSILFESFLLGDSQLKYKINAKIYDTLNFVWNEIYKKNRKNRKNRISSDEVNTNKPELLERMYDSAHDIICEVQNKMLKITIDMFELYEKDMDKVHLINNKLKEIMIKLKQDLRKIFNKEDLEYK